MRNNIVMTVVLYQYAAFYLVAEYGALCLVAKFSTNKEAVMVVHGMYCIGLLV